MERLTGLYERAMIGGGLLRYFSAETAICVLHN